MKIRFQVITNTTAEDYKLNVEKCEMRTIQQYNTTITSHFKII